MKKKITITEAIFNENKNELMLSTDEQISVGSLKPMEQMLVDSDNLSFIYITDHLDDYTYIVIPEPFWSVLKKAMDQDSSVYLTNGNEDLQLSGLHEELAYLIENIKGNSNYGEVMVEKVEGIFN